MKLKKETDYIKVPVKVKSSISKTGRVSEAGIDKPSESSTIPPAGNYEDLNQRQKASLHSFCQFFVA